MRNYSIPNNLNIILAVGSCGSSLVLLYMSSIFEYWPYKVACAAAFAYTNNTVFSLLHEAVHGIFHTNRKVNYLAGCVLAAFFPTGYTFQAACHLSHHRHNRDSAEQFDLIRPGDTPILRRLQWYGILTGLYWTLPPLSAMLLLLMPNYLINIAEHAVLKKQAQATGAQAMLEQIQSVDIGKARIEILFSLILQCIFLYLIDFNWGSWVLCYGLFGLNWSSLQYADHAWSELDRTEGAWDLRTHWLVQMLFLNYHLHRAHHQKPNMSWIHLPKFVDEERPRPCFGKLYRLMWQGPQPISQHDKMHKKVIEKCL